MVSSCSAVELEGSANRSPATMANENGVFDCSLEIFSKMDGTCPSIDPRMMLKTVRIKPYYE